MHHESSRPPLDRTRLDAAVSEDLPWRQVDIVEVAESTNALAGERAAGGEASGLVIVAEHQTAGRGRLDRHWETPERAALTFSLLLRPDVPASRWPWLPLLAGVGVVEALRRETGLDAALKWPNDILVDGKKVGGILVERVETPDGPAAIIGIGINVTTRADELPVPEAGSLELSGSKTTDRTGLLAEILHTLGHDYTAWVHAHGDPSTGLRRRYVDFSATIGSQVRITMPGDKVLVGTATGVDEAGMLEVDSEQGTQIVSVGDVVHLRGVE